MANFKPVIGFDDNLSNHLQNYAHTAYAVSKMRAGRTPKDVDGNVITDANKIFRPGLYYLEAGATHVNNSDTPSTGPAYLYMYVQDPDESLKGGHALEDSTTTWHKNVVMNVRQVQYGDTTVTTRTGVRDSTIDTLYNYKVVSTVQRIQSELGTSILLNQYAYIKDIGMWIKYSTSNTTDGIVVDWKPAVTWDDWKTINGDSPVKVIDASTFTGDLVPGNHYINSGSYTLTLPDANTCELGAKVTIEQWKNSSIIRTFNQAHTEVLYEMQLDPGIITCGLTDMKLHDDCDIGDNGQLYTKSNGLIWSTTVGSTSWIVSKVELKKTDSETKAPERYAVYSLDENGNKILKRLCYNDVTYPYSISVTYYKTSDTIFQTGKTYYVKQTTEGVDYYIEATVEYGQIIPLTPTYYNASPTATWYDATGVTASDITVAEITSLAKKYTYFTIKDVEDNIAGACEYTFEVTQDPNQSNRRMWVLNRCSDMEAFAGKINEAYGNAIEEHTTQISTINALAETNAAEIASIKRKYVLKEKRIRMSTTTTIYGDNAKVVGEELITYDDSKYLDPVNLSEDSYSIEYFLARYIPVYQCAKFTGDAFIAYLPTRAKSMVGLRITFILEPGAKIKIYDDCSVTHGGPYEFNGSTDTSSEITKLTIVDCVLNLYKDDSGTDQLVWTYKSNIVSNSVTSSESGEAARLIAEHDASSTAHSSLLAGKEDAGTASSFVSSHNTDSTAHAGLFVSPTSMTTAISTHNSASTAHSGLFDSSGAATSAVDAHNNATDVHAGLFSNKASLTSPAFTGTPTAPTATDRTYTSQLANCQFVGNAVIIHNNDSTTHTAAFSAHNADTTAHAAAFSAVLSANGYQKFPSGLIIQWGTTNVTSATKSGLDYIYKFPIAFSSACFSIAQAGTKSYDRGQKFYTINTTSFGVYASAHENTAWIAIGI